MFHNNNLENTILLQNSYFTKKKREIETNNSYFYIKIQYGAPCVYIICICAMTMLYSQYIYTREIRKFYILLYVNCSNDLLYFIYAKMYIHFVNFLNLYDRINYMSFCMCTSDMQYLSL